MDIQEIVDILASLGVDTDAEEIVTLCQEHGYYTDDDEELIAWLYSELE